MMTHRGPSVTFGRSGGRGVAGGHHNGGVRDATAGYPVHRTGGGGIIAWVWIGAVGVLVVSVLWAHSSLSEIGGALVVASTVGPAYIWGLRPRLEENPEGLLVANPLREVFVPWSALTYARVNYVLELWTADGTEVSVFAVPRETSTQRFRRRGLGSGLTLTGPVPQIGEVSGGGIQLSAPEQIAFDLNERVEHAPKDQVAEPVTAGWSPVAIRVLTASLAVAVLGLLAATL